MNFALRRAISAARWLVMLEIGIWRSLFLWVTRRRPGRRPGSQAFSYGREVRPLLMVIIFVSALELVVVHLLLPWATVRLIALVLSVWGLLWMVGYLASIKVFPHLLDHRELRVRFGTTTDIRIPWEAIAGVNSKRRRTPTRRSVQIQGADDGIAVDVPVLRQTRVDVAMREPTTVELPDGPQEITELRLYADDPGALVAAARERLSQTPRPLLGRAQAG